MIITTLFPILIKDNYQLFIHILWVLATYSVLMYLAKIIDYRKFTCNELQRSNDFINSQTPVVPSFTVSKFVKNQYNIITARCFKQSPGLWWIVLLSQKYFTDTRQNNSNSPNLFSFYSYISTMTIKPQGAHITTQAYLIRNFPPRLRNRSWPHLSPEV
jgi:hypothetical protein